MIYENNGGRKMASKRSKQKLAIVLVFALIVGCIPTKMVKT